MWLWFFSLPRSPPCYECHAGWRWFQCPKLSLALTWDLNIFTFLHNFLIKHTCFVFVARLVSSAAGQGSAAAGIPNLRGFVTIKQNLRSSASGQNQTSLVWVWASRQTRNCAILNSFKKWLTESILKSFWQLFLQNCDSLTPILLEKGRTESIHQLSTPESLTL